MNVAIIPARGGSKRIPRKNIKIFAGEPIIARSIRTALDFGVFGKVVVSTDDEEIASIAVKYGAEVPFIRPVSLADDVAGTNAVVKHAIQWLHDNNCIIDLACCIYATAPFIQQKYLKEGYDKIINSGKSFAFSVATYPAPIQRSIRINDQGLIESIWPGNIQKRSQDLEQTYHDAGQFYWGRAEAYLGDEEMFSELSIPVVIPRYLVQDIDDVEDWKRAELMFSTLQLSGEVFA